MGFLWSDLSGPAYIYRASAGDQANVNFYVDAGSPAAGTGAAWQDFWYIIIEPGVTLYSTDPAVPAAVTGAFKGWLAIKNYGRIAGAGGHAGAGAANTGKTLYHGGAAGGGAGRDPGAGWNIGETTGNSGTETDGGVGKVFRFNTPPYNPLNHVHLVPGTPPDYHGQDGGTALKVTNFWGAFIYNQAGQMWGGGGGGGGGHFGGDGGSGGDPGEAGEDDGNPFASGPTPVGGAGGASVDKNGRNVYWQAGFGDLKGPIIP